MKPCSRVVQHEDPPGRPRPTPTSLLDSHVPSAPEPVESGPGRRCGRGGSPPTLRPSGCARVGRQHMSADAPASSGRTEDREAAAVRDEVRAWLAENWDPERPLLEWRGLLADSGWGCPAWPGSGTGAGCAPALVGVVTEEFRAAGRGRHRGRRRRQPGRQHDPGPRLRRAEGHLPPADHHRRAQVVPAVQRAGQRLGPRRPHHPGGAGRRRVGRQRPEGLEHRRPQGATTASCWPAPTGTSPSTAASRTSSSTCTSPASRCARCAR